MRLAELHLRAFGHFDDVRVDLDAGGNALHVVYGHNEAGKSTTLRALGGLFFGIPTRTTDAYRHPMPKLRIGARLVAEDGSVVDVVRKKGRKNTLLDPEGNPIDEGVMRALLVHVGQEQFEVMFGLDHVSLRQGAKALLSAGGDVGESLYGASLGGGIHDLLTALDDEARELYKPRGQNQTLNAAIAEFDKAKKSLRDREVSVDGYESTLAELDKARAELTALKAQRSELHAERGRVARAVRVMPGLATLRRLRAEREGLDAPGVMAAVLPEILADLREQLPVILKSERDLPNREAELREAEAQARELLEALGAGGDLTAGRALLPSASTREGLRRLIEKHGKVTTDVEHARESLEEKRTELEGLAEQEDVPVEDLTAVEAALANARPLVDAPGRLAELAAEKAALRGTAERCASALAGFEGDAAVAAALAVPDQASVARDADARVELARSVEDAEGRTRALSKKLAEVEAEIAAEDEEGAVPSEADLRRQRRDRDRQWAAVRRSLEDRGAEQEGLALDAVDPDGYEAAVSRADESADVMRQQADRVAQRAQRESQKREIEREIAATEAEVEAAREALKAHDDETRARWKAIGVDAADAEAMRHWLTRHGELLRAYEAMEAKGREHAALEARAGETRTALGAALGDAHQDLGVLVKTAEARVQRAVEARTRRRSRRERQRAVEAELAKLEKRLGHRLAALEAWRSEWATLVEALNLEANASPREVSDVLETLNQLGSAYGTCDEKQERIDKMHKDAERFAQDVDALVSAHAPDLAPLPLAERGRALVDRIDEAHARAREIERLDEEIEAERRKVLDAGDGKSIEELTEETEGLDLGQQRGRESNIDAELEQLDEEVMSAALDVDRKEGGLQTYQTRTSAAEAADDAEEVLARVREAAHRYVRLRLAREVLRLEIARFREENQGPILEKANALFPRLTRGAYTSLKVVTGDADEPVLSCVRSDGDEVGVEGLSDGTKDQLYLALRLASLLHFAEHNAPLPLILDDCLVHFDDDRARAALEVLGEVSKSFQILFFTHHRRLVELAREAVPEDRLRVRDLGELRSRAEARA
jgi:uncharacterized protein YhaN